MYIFLSHENLFKSSIYIYFEGNKCDDVTRMAKYNMVLA